MGVTLDLRGNDIQVGSAITSSTNSGFLSATMFVEDAQNQVVAASYAVSHTVFVCPNVSATYAIEGVSVSFGTASTSGTLQVEVATGTQAIAAGTNQLTGTMSLSGTANTTVNGTMIASPTTISAGNRINLIFAGTVTNLANAIVTIALRRIS